jgi:hypothetical protein
MYKLGPIHHGVLERGAKTASDSYILWPAKVGAFSLVMGRHVFHQDTSDLPFSYLIEQQSTTYIVPGANLKSVGTIRDAIKWPQRDARRDPDRLDCVNFNLLSPYTIRKMLNAVSILNQMKMVSGDSSDSYSYQSGRIRSSSLANGLRYYNYAIDKFFGNSLITRIIESGGEDFETLHDAFVPRTAYGDGEWLDVAGMIAPEKAVEDLLNDVQSGAVHDLAALGDRFADMHENYYKYEWKWALQTMEEYYGFRLCNACKEDIAALVNKWKHSVIALDQLIYEDARKEYALNGREGFEDDPFVKSVVRHMKEKSALAEEVLHYLKRL